MPATSRWRSRSTTANGSVGMPIRAAFWGGRFGVVTDKFGTEWMVTLP